MRGFWPIYKRELFALFITPLAWVLITAFLVAGSGLLREAGFTPRVVVGEDDNAGVAVFDRARRS